MAHKMKQSNSMALNSPTYFPKIIKQNFPILYHHMIEDILKWREVAIIWVWENFGVTRSFLAWLAASSVVLRSGCVVYSGRVVAAFVRFRVWVLKQKKKKKKTEWTNAEDRRRRTRKRKEGHAVLCVCDFSSIPSFGLRRPLLCKKSLQERLQYCKSSW